VAQIVRSPLLDTIMNAVNVETAFDSSVECLSSVFRDTREVDESMDLIQVLYPRLLTLQPKLKLAAAADDAESLKGLTRIFAEAGESWVVLIARMPKDFRGLVEAVLEACIHDKEKESVRLTFNFWYDLKQMVMLEKWEPARQEFLSIYTALVDVMIKHLEYPSPDGDETDLFDGDRDLEEKFREFRHEMGDVLKDCCEVITVTECLDKAFNLIKKWGNTYASQASETHVPHWQELEAPLFAMRAMGRMVSPDEETVLHQVLPLIVQIPNHEKLQFQAVMAIGRYTEWTAAHPEYLQPQFNFVVKAFNHPSVEVVRAAALAFRFFGVDCRHLLQGEITQIQGFYETSLDKLPIGSQEELTEGVANIISGQPRDKIYAALKMFCDPVVERLKQRAEAAKNAMEGKAAIEAVAHTIDLITTFLTNVQPYYETGESNQAVAYCQDIFPILSRVGEGFASSPQVLEPLCRCWRNMVFSYRTAIFPLLEPLANQLSKGFETTRQGCFLWATTAVLREFSVDTEAVDANTTQAIYNFFEQQAFAFLKIMNDLPPTELPDGEYLAALMNGCLTIPSH
jgi:transportin-3